MALSDAERVKVASSSVGLFPCASRPSRQTLPVRPIPVKSDGAPRAEPVVFCVGGQTYKPLVEWNEIRSSHGDFNPAIPGFRNLVLGLDQRAILTV